MNAFLAAACQVAGPAAQRPVFLRCAVSLKNQGRIQSFQKKKNPSVIHSVSNMRRWDLSCLPAFGEARIRSFYLGKNENVFARWGPKLTQVQAQQANTTDESTSANSRCPLNFSTPSFTSV